MVTAATAQRGPTLSAALRVTVSFPLDETAVTSCLLDRPADEIFRRAFDHGLASLPVGERRGALASTTGHIAESVVAALFEALGYFVVSQFTGVGGHGIDLLELSPDTNRLLAIEVKGTLRRRRWPRLTKGDVAQFSPAWLDKLDNPGVAAWDLGSTDLYGAIVLVNFADRRWKVVLTEDFELLRPITSLDELSDLAWLDRQ